MNRMFLLSYLLIIASGCSSYSKKLKQPLINERVGIHILDQDSNKLCFEYFGLTIFNNEYSEYPLEGDLEKNTIDALTTAVKKSNNVPVVIPVDTKYRNPDLFNHSSNKLTPIGKKYLSTLAKNNRLKNIFIDLQPTTTFEYCTIKLSNQYASSKFSEANLYTNYSFRLYDAEKGELKAAAGISGGSHTVPLPKDKTKLTEKEVVQAVKHRYLRILQQNYRLLSKSKKSIIENVNLEEIKL